MTCHGSWQKKSLWHITCIEKKGNRTLYRLYKAIGVELNYQGIGV